MALHGILVVVLHLRKLYSEVGDPHRLLLDRLGQGGYLLLLRCDQTLVGLDSSILGSDHVLLVREHLVFHLLQDPCDLTALWSVGTRLLARKEGQHSLAIGLEEPTAACHKPLHKPRGPALQKVSCHAFLKCFHRFPHGDQIGLALSQCLVEGGLFRLPDCRCLRHGLVRGIAVLLVRRQVALELCLLLRVALNTARELCDFCLSGFNAGGEVATAAFAVARVLFEELVRLLTLLCDLCLHGLKHCHNFADRVGR
mmetsp:Transcript_81032/g.204818  ORF Transcript_81032/g.204818 Transcript_81032/m.204818 type:complete len:255 (-) Transcript_81032:124-888(-)